MYIDSITSLYTSLLLQGVVELISTAFNKTIHFLFYIKGAIIGAAAGGAVGGFVITMVIMIFVIVCILCTR